VKLLAYFSPIAQKKLVDERDTILTIPNGSKKATLWVYKYMQAGEHDPVGLDTFEALDSNTLIVIYQHCDFLGYEPLKKRIYSRLKGKFYNALPTVDEIELYQTSIPKLYEYALHCLSGEMVNPWTRNYGPYSRLAETNEAFGKTLGDAMDKFFTSRVKASETYYQETTNRDVIWATKYIDAVLAGTVRPKKPFPRPMSKAKQMRNVAPGLLSKTRLGTPPVADVILSRKNNPTTPVQQNQQQDAKPKKPFKCYTCGNEGHMSRNCNANSQDPAFSNIVSKLEKPVYVHKVREPFNCYKCGGEGHIARNCTVAVKKTTERPPPVCFKCEEMGHVARNCTQEKPVTEIGNSFSTSSHPRRKPKSKEPFICSRCGGEGHMARECTVEEPSTGVEFVGIARPVRATAGRNKQFRDAQRDPEIEVLKNGEGLATCDREVRKGEMMRTGLIV
jgi:hypothetical protein